jgi:carboxyl-terminal processing protease
MKKSKNYGSTFIIIILAFILGNYFGSYTQPIQKPIETQEDIINETIIETQETDLNFDLFQDVWEILQEKYVDPEVFSEKKKFEYAFIKGLIEGLDDDYSGFMTPEENKNFQDGLHGNFEGIGAELTIKDGNVIIVTPLKQSPAKKAGIMPEDIIIKVDNNIIKNQPLYEVVKQIRGEKGTDVVLEIFRPNENQTIDITITRDVIQVASVESSMKGDIAYIEINQFGDDTVLEFSKNIRKLYTNKPKGIILDLRFNGGGYLEGAIDIASAFLEKGTDIVEVKSKDSSIIHKSKYTVFSNTELPMVILINKGSASASEIVAGALKDNNRAVLIGETSFGKGTVQEVIPLAGKTSLRVTIARGMTS